MSRSGDKKRKGQPTGLNQLPVKSLDIVILKHIPYSATLCGGSYALLFIGSLLKFGFQTSALSPLQTRNLALENMCSLAKENGRAVLGLRSLHTSPCEHVMVASQNEGILGIYHTFSRDELQSQLLPNQIHLFKQDSFFVRKLEDFFA